MLGTAPTVIANATAASATYLAVNRTPAPTGPAAGSPTSQPTGPLTGIDFSTGLPPLPPGVGTDAVLREWATSAPPATRERAGRAGASPRHTA